MPFDPTTRNEALVLAARHCCVCHRYKGLKIEVHHIIQEADGGENTLDNAIALCFDCHADAGHYNPKHPRGTKFSPQELKLARDTWHKIVQSRSIANPANIDTFYCRYFLCKSFESISEVVQGNLSDFPVESPLLLRTPTFEFLTSVVTEVGKQFRLPREWGESFQSEDEYVRTHPDTKKIRDNFNDGQQWLQFERIPTLNELKNKVGNKDYITRSLLDGNLQPIEICKVRAFTDGCGDVLLQEEYQLRPLWVAYLAITNDSDHRIRLTKLDASMSGVGTPSSFAGINDTVEHKPHTISFPAVEVQSKATVILPVAIILGPIGETPEERTWTNNNVVTNGQMQEVSHSCFLSTAINDSLFWGPVLSSPQLFFMNNGKEQLQEIHEFDLGNLYTLDRYWMMGSCPHLFSIDVKGAIRYLGEIFAGQPNVPQIASVAIEEDICWLVLAELEDERTYIRFVSQNNCKLMEDVNLEKGDYLVLPVTGGSTINISGQYDLLYLQPAHAQKNFDRVRSIIQSFVGYLAFDRPALTNIRGLTQSRFEGTKSTGVDFFV